MKVIWFLKNVLDSIRVRRECASNEIDGKYEESKISTLSGMTMDLRDEYRHPSDSSCLNGEFYSNTIDESHLRDEKYDEARILRSPAISYILMDC
jgi:hypothetical protein